MATFAKARTDADGPPTERGVEKRRLLTSREGPRHCCVAARTSPLSTTINPAPLQEPAARLPPARRPLDALTGLCRPRGSLSSPSVRLPRRPLDASAPSLAALSLHLPRPCLVGALRSRASSVGDCPQVSLSFARLPRPFYVPGGLRLSVGPSPLFLSSHREPLAHVPSHVVGDAAYTLLCDAIARLFGVACIASRRASSRADPLAYALRSRSVTIAVRLFFILFKRVD